MTSREVKYHKDRKLTKRLKRKGVGFARYKFPRIKPIGERKDGPFFAMMIPTGGLKHWDGSSVEVDPKYLNPQQ